MIATVNLSPIMGCQPRRPPREAVRDEDRSRRRRATDGSLRYGDISSKAIGNERGAADFMLDSTDDVINIEVLRGATLV
jgi:hypothetical protein